MTPYYRSTDGAIVVYHARFEDVINAGLVPVLGVALIHDDPPYGLNIRASGRGEGRMVNTGRPKARSFEPIVGDDKPYDPAPLLELQRPLVTWGANHYASRLPPSPSWLIWDKRDGTTPDDGSDAELAWSNIGGPARIFRHIWKGTLRASETGVPHLYAAQKPIALCSWVYQRAKLQRGDLVFVPHMGSGPDLAACLGIGLRCIACDVSEEACRVAVGARLGAVKPGYDGPIGPLFDK